jgi:hypothetical protein
MITFTETSTFSLDYNQNIIFLSSQTRAQNVYFHSSSINGGLTIKYVYRLRVCDPIDVLTAIFATQLGGQEPKQMLMFTDGM